MNFQQLKHNDPMVESAFQNFCISSKPLDFCLIKSPSEKIAQIKRYYNHLLNNSNAFYLVENNRIVFFISIVKREFDITIEFIFGDPWRIERNFKAFREFYWQKFDCLLPFVGEVRRSFKLKTYLKYIQKKDPCAKIFLDKDPILVLYSRNGL
jgi:hypothetical protein